MENHISYSYMHLIRDLTSYVKPYKSKFLTGFFLRLTSDIADLYPAFAISQIITLLTTQSTEHLAQLVVIFGIWMISLWYHNFGQNSSKYLGYQVAESMGLDLYKKTLAHTLKLDLSWQEKENSGNKMQRIEHGREGVNQLIRRIFDVLIEVSVNTIGIVCIFFTLDSHISLALIFFMVTYYTIGTFLLKHASHQERLVNKKMEDMSGLTFESLNNIHTIKSLGIAQGILGAFQQKLSLLREQIYKRIFLFQSRNFIVNTYEALFEFTATAYIAWGILNGQYTLSFLVLFLGLFHRVGVSTRELTDVMQEIVVSKVWISRAMHILQTTPAIEQPQAFHKPYPLGWKKLHLHNLSFTYGKRHILKNINLTITRGEKVGIVGLSGAGKSTLFKLLLDLYESYEGDILLDDIPLKQLHRQAYIEHIAVVLQDTELFNMTLKENIQLAQTPFSGNLSLDTIIERAHLTDVIAHLPQGLNTVVGEKGIKLSGGQRQRVGIARALYRQPDMLLLDEATSHLDATSEKHIQQALHDCMHTFTTIIIAHRLSTLKEVDTILVLEKGTITEKGSFAQLLKKKGTFARMWKAQKI